jgi:H+/gluconate symporter-like permease
VVVALAPFVVMIAVNLLMSFVILPRREFSFLQGEQWANLSIASASGLWSVLVALACAIGVLLVLNRRRLMSVRESMDAGANASVLPVLSVASLVGFGAIVAAMPAFAEVRDWILGIDGGLLVSLSVSVNVLAALTGSASGGMTIALDALGATYLALAQQQGINPDLLHRIAAIGAGTLDSLPHNGAVVTLLAVCGTSHRDSYLHIAMTAIVGPIVALVAVIALGSVFGSF